MTQQTQAPQQPQAAPQPQTAPQQTSSGGGKGLLGCGIGAIIGCIIGGILILVIIFVLIIVFGRGCMSYNWPESPPPVENIPSSET